MKDDLRIKFFEELQEKLGERGILALVKVVKPENGETIKINGKVLFKRILTSNPWKDIGIVLHPSITDSFLEKFNGKRMSKGKWVGCPLTEESYSLIMECLVSIAENINSYREEKITKKIKTEKKKKKEPVVEVKPPKAKKFKIKK